MGYKHDQTLFPETFRPDPSTDQQPQSTEPPALPPRLNPASRSPYLQPPPYAETAPTYHSQPLAASWASLEPRSSSTQSLVPAESLGGKRMLLLIFIHGFLGTESSFQSFPAHVHNLVAVILADTHVVHTKIYPRYKSRKAIEYARDDFSNWLCPHESPNTDVILIGHSMGGILAAEVALLPPYSRTSMEKFRHRIVGTINFDCPFLGMHPGVVFAGISSLFRSTPESPGPQSSDMTTGDDISPATSSQLLSAGSASVQTSNNSTFTNSDTDLSSDISTKPGSVNTLQALLSPTVPCPDPNFNPHFLNDMSTPVRKGWDSAIHFMTKHSDGLTQATKSYVTSHLEFGGCLADYKGLKDRYSRVRPLENIDPQASHATRVRFVNYYTASTGRPKKLKTPLPPPSQRIAQLSQRVDPEEPVERNLQDMSLSNQCSPSLAPSISIEEHQNGSKVLKASQDSIECSSVASSQSAQGDSAMSDLASEMNPLDAASTLDSQSDDHTMKMNQNNSPATSGIMTSTASTVSAKSMDNQSETKGQFKAETDHLLPPLPPSPKQPPAFSPSSYTDKDVRNLAQKEYSRQNKAYIQALKDYAKAIREREKLMEKRAKAADKVSKKETKRNEKENTKAKREEAKLKSSPTPSALNSAIVRGRGDSPNSSGDDRRLTSSEPTKPIRHKKFCMLPPKVNGQIDPCWVRVLMRDMDEVGAHCGLFFVGDQYEWLVSDVGNRIKEWIQERKLEVSRAQQKMVD